MDNEDSFHQAGVPGDVIMSHSLKHKYVPRKKVLI